MAQSIADERERLSIGTSGKLVKSTGTERVAFMDMRGTAVLEHASQVVLRAIKGAVGGIGFRPQDQIFQFAVDLLASD